MKNYRCVSEIGLRRLQKTAHRESINFIKKWGRHSLKVSISLLKKVMSPVGGTRDAAGHSRHTEKVPISLTNHSEKLSLCIRNWPPKIAKNGTQRKYQFHEQMGAAHRESTNFMNKSIGSHHRVPAKESTKQFSILCVP